MLRFEKNLHELNEVYDNCLNNFEVALALYPENARLAKLQEKYSYFFKMFGESSPISKLLNVGNGNDNDGQCFNEDDDDLFVPKFSLGLTQMTPKNLCSDIDGSDDSPVKRQVGGTHDIMVVQHELRDKGKNIAGYVRPRRDTKASHFCTSPYVSRVVDVSAHQITAEERNVWDWLFHTRRNKKYFNVLVFVISINIKCLPTN